MPVINRERYRYEQGEFVRIIKFSSREGYFSCNLPPWIVEILNTKRVIGDTLDEVKNNYMKALKEAKTKSTVVRKVITYEIKVAGYIFRPTKESPDGRCILRRNSRGWGSDISPYTGLEIAYNVGEERTITVGGKTRIEYWDIDPDMSSPSRESAFKTTIDWTPQREEFFKRLKYQMEELILKAVEFLDDSKTLLDMIDAGRMLPLLPDGNGEKKFYKEIIERKEE